MKTGQLQVRADGVIIPHLNKTMRVMRTMMMANKEHSDAGVGRAEKAPSGFAVDLR